MVAVDHSTAMKLVERHHVSPPQNSVPSIDLPLTFLDTFWIPFSRTQRFFLYKLPSISTTSFLHEILPGLKNSLSISLQHFFPLAGSVVLPSQPDSRPYIRYKDGYYVNVTVMESSKDFDYLSRKGQHSLISADDFVALVPGFERDETMDSPLLALQVTVFPDSGICLGVTYRHVVADGKSIMDFIRTWSEIFRKGGIMPENFVAPVIDRSLILDPDYIIQETFFKQSSVLAPLVEAVKPEEDQVVLDPLVRATFEIKRHEIQKLRQWITTRAKTEDLHLSTFVVIVSFVWVNLLKSETAVEKISTDHAADGHRLCNFSCAVDCRDRYEYKSVVPSTYFGNCLSVMSDVSAKRAELEGENGLLVAVQAIGKRIKEMESEGALKDAEMWITKLIESSKTGSMFSIAGSPRLGVYELDFGWGRPEKVEVVTIDPSRMSLAESRDDLGGVEIGLALKRKQMEVFIAIRQLALTSASVSCPATQ